MRKTVKEIIEMIKAGTLCYNQSTQRKFVYADEPAKTMRGNVTTKAGSLINAILEEGIQLPALYFWHNSETSSCNIHDGKQRVLSLYYFINPTPGVNVITIRNGKETSWLGLEEADREKLLNYTFDIVERTGTSVEEERSFYLINTNSLNLTNYECISGMLHGTFLDEFEKYIDGLSKTYDSVKPVGRGDQAYKILLTMFDLSDAKKSASNDGTMLLLSNRIEPLRNNLFEPKSFSLNEVLEAFNELMRAVKGLKEDAGLTVASYMVRKGYSCYDIINYYRECSKGINDITSWDLQTHRTFIDAFVNGTKLDPQRAFSKDIKDALYRKSSRCSHIDENGNRCNETSYSKLEVDHIVPWSKGGRTVLDNAQLLCKSHNSGKGNKED